jgi:hypothetical protein
MPRLTRMQLRQRRSAELHAEMAETIAEGRMTVRQMTPEERAEGDVRRAEIRASHPPRRRRWPTL